MTYDQATIEKAARLLCENPALEHTTTPLRLALAYCAIDAYLNRKDDIEEALRRAVEETK